MGGIRVRVGGDVREWGGESAAGMLVGAGGARGKAGIGPTDAKPRRTDSRPAPNAALNLPCPAGPGPAPPGPPTPRGAARGPHTAQHPVISLLTGPHDIRPLLLTPASRPFRLFCRLGLCVVLSLFSLIYPTAYAFRPFHCALPFPFPLSRMSRSWPDAPWLASGLLSWSPGKSWVLLVASACLSCAVVRATEPGRRHLSPAPLTLLLHDASAPSHKYYRLQLTPLLVLNYFGLVWAGIYNPITPPPRPRCPHRIQARCVSSVSVDAAISWQLAAANSCCGWLDIG